ncbi:MAG TPA: hypothetical protein VFU15_15075 [Bacteroidia bacterium]|nr:hypothetical protein [Bacteroidia bacterium]
MITFSETQRFRQWWIWLSLAAMEAYIIYGFVQQIVLGHPFGSRPAPDWALYILICVPSLFVGLAVSLRLETKINGDGVFLRYKPFINTTRAFLWKDVGSAFVRQYRPIAEYGGWGIRGNFYGRWNGKAYSVSGNMGLQLVMKNGKKILIGTCNAEELKAVLQRLADKKLVINAEI